MIPASDLVAENEVQIRVTKYGMASFPHLEPMLYKLVGGYVPPECEAASLQRLGMLMRMLHRLAASLSQSGCDDSKQEQTLDSFTPDHIGGLARDLSLWLQGFGSMYWQVNFN